MIQRPPVLLGLHRYIPRSDPSQWEAEGGVPVGSILRLCAKHNKAVTSPRMENGAQ